ncbi:MAG: hypothetical protein LUD40_16725 [Phocaeicola dorei]|nr:hypothetical protein [Phocaeicola dorei]
MNRKETNERKRMSKNNLSLEHQEYKLNGNLPIEEHILNFDVLNSTAEQARELVAWLQLELKAMRNIHK